MSCDFDQYTVHSLAQLFMIRFCLVYEYESTFSVYIIHYYTKQLTPSKLAFTFLNFNTNHVLLANITVSIFFIPCVCFFYIFFSFVQNKLFQHSLVGILKILICMLTKKYDLKQAFLPHPPLENS